MEIGFTGTREGMNDAQLAQLDRVLRWLGPSRHAPPTFHYGTHGTVALHADAAAARLAVAQGYRLQPWHAVRGTELRRDRAQVAAIEVLIAAPATDVEQPRSGTWATVRYARARKLPIILLTRGA